MRISICTRLLINACFFGQRKPIQNIVSTVSIERLKKNLYYLASTELEDSLMGSKGDTLVSECVINCFKENHLAAPYKNGTSYFQTVNTFKKTFCNLN